MRWMMTYTHTHTYTHIHCDFSKFQKKCFFFSIHIIFGYARSCSSIFLVHHRHNILNTRIYMTDKHTHTHTAVGLVVPIIPIVRCELKLIFFTILSHTKIYFRYSKTWAEGLNNGDLYMLCTVLRKLLGAFLWDI